LKSKTTALTIQYEDEMSTGKLERKKTIKRKWSYTGKT